MLLLLTRPRYDTPTHYLFYWAGLLIDEAKKKMVEIIDLDKKRREERHYAAICIDDQLIL